MEGWAFLLTVHQLSMDLDLLQALPAATLQDPSPTGRI